MLLMLLLLPLPLPFCLSRQVDSSGQPLRGTVRNYGPMCAAVEKHFRGS